MSQPGMGAMLHVLGGGSPRNPSAFYGRKITSATLDDNTLKLSFADGTGLRLWDDGQSCCESRYITCDDDLNKIVGGELRRIDIDRIKAKVTITSAGCWECSGFQHKLRNVKSHDKGYVALSYRGTQQRVHRLMYRLLVGRIPDGMQVNHKCDNPPCCNPDHLFLGDQNANMRDMADKKRDKAGITHCIRGHELAGENIRIWPTKTGYRRQCKLCDRIHQRMRMGWTEEEAINTPPIPQGEQSARRVIGVRNRGSVA